MSRHYNTRLYCSNKKKKSIEGGRNAILIGESTEKYIADIISSFKDIKNVEVIGNIGGMFDITYQCKNEDITRAIQVKTLTNTGNDSWSVSIPRQYFPDTLMVFINIERDRFGLIYYRDINVKYLTLSFKSIKKGKYRFNKFNTLDVFKNALHRRLFSSSMFNIESSTSDTILKEYYSLKRLEDKCINNKLTYFRNISNGTVIDCYIDNLAVQCKYSSLSSSNSSCRFSIIKSNGSNKMQPYHYNDPINYFIFEIGGIEGVEDKYKGYFCIIPKDVLNDLGYLQNDVSAGKTSISLCLPDNNNDHWSKSYWNNFDSIKNE